MGLNTFRKCDMCKVEYDYGGAHNPKVCQHCRADYYEKENKAKLRAYYLKKKAEKLKEKNEGKITN